MSTGSDGHRRNNLPSVSVVIVNWIRASSSEYIALLNNDAQPEPHWLEVLVHALEAHPEAGFCASKMLRADDPRVIDTVGDVFYDYGVGGKRGMDQHRVPPDQGAIRSPSAEHSYPNAAQYRNSPSYLNLDKIRRHDEGRCAIIEALTCGRFCEEG